MAGPRDDSVWEALFTGQRVRAAGDDEGFWAPHTAPIDWCEENYAVSPFIAEFHNAWTNLAYIAVGLWVLLRPRGGGPFVAAAAISTILTGATSLGFHVTLSWIWQKLDESFENAILVYIWYDTVEESSGPGRRFRSATLHALGAAAIILLDPPFLFAELHLVTVILLSLHKFWRLCGARPELRPYVYRAAAATVLGFACWLADRTGCTHLHGALELHAAWHIATAAALGFGLEGIAELHRSTKAS
mmetsp:Transcript_24993/g.78268  ORF Transcript_24993/g.78268 Transcript_24993/m.78268 type:complete len:246 (-) Transcript_24993:84-821(-)|eukprot:CAMPEP_0118878446 /NCGR_PEP_ID=MMETSP1163-20130328/18352_1 /TAXON_ID=124430 /ORGANISM="Phaeomonas parva, Strain CCMP2877" /LENGTH=245 /DNA_ID=CAMNT_0006814275 /DNA_START=251 /DNA_END=988 /DNA_ORIENTATION=+